MPNLAEYTVKIVADGKQNNLKLSLPVIQLENYHILFSVKNNGYLTIDADSCSLILGNNNTTEISVKGSLKNFLVEEGNIITIINPINLKNIYFEKINDE